MIKDIYQWLETAGQEPSEPKVSLAIKLIEEELQELKDAWAKGDRVEFLDAVVDLYWVVSNASYFAGEPIESVQEYVEKVSLSNWSKFCTSKTVADLTVIAYQEGTHPSKLGEKIDCYAEQVRELWVVKRRDGKILKGLNYREPNHF